MEAWDVCEGEELDVCIYTAIQEGMLVVHSHTEDGEALYEITELGMARGRAAAAESGYDPDDLDEAELFAFAGGLVG